MVIDYVNNNRNNSTVETLLSAPLGGHKLLTIRSKVG